jgi:hypothetical protein
MLAERMPQGQASLLSQGLGRWVGFCVARPRTIVIAGLIVTALALAVSFAKLTFRTSRAELLNPKSEYNQRWLSYTEEFGDKEDVVVVVEAPTQAAIVLAMDDLAGVIEQKPAFYQDVLHRYDLTKVGSKGLHYLDRKQLGEIEGFLGKAEPILHGDWAQLNVGNLAGWMQAGLERVPPEQRQQALTAMQVELGRTAEGLAAALGPSCSYKSPWPDIAAAAVAIESLGSNYMITDDGRLGFVVLKFAQNDNQNLAQNSAAIDELRATIAAAQTRHPTATIGLTGLPVIENDEMRSSESSSTYATLLSFVGVFLVLLLAFGGFRHASLMMLVLMIGTIWTCGWTALTIGHLNLLSIAFGTILFGLGIDYGIAYLSAYLRLRPMYDAPGEALVAAAEEHGPVICAAAVTSAMAFFLVGLTEFSGIAQLGMIAGTGLLLCFVAMITMLPALFILVDGKRSMSGMPVPLELSSTLVPLFRRPLVTGVGLLFVTLGLGVGARHLWYDYNLLNLHPDGIESVELERKLLHETNLSASFALSVADTPAELLALKKKFLELPTVERVEEISSLFPAFGTDRQPVIHRIHQQVAYLPSDVPQIPVVPQAQLEHILAYAQQMLAIAPDGQALSAKLELLCGVLRQLPPDEYMLRMTRYQQAMANDLLARLHALQSVSNPEPPALSDLPEGLTARFVGKTGKHVQKIYGKVDLWDMDGMERFVNEVRTVDPEATGNPMQIYEASRHMRDSFEWAAWYTVLAVVPVVFLHFRKISHSLLALTPMALGLAQLFGLMGALDITLNPANMIVLPFLIGMGIDEGVHVVDDFRRQGAKYCKMDNATALTVVVNSVTTLVGFAALMIATHKGLQSLGRVLVIGVACCLISALLMPNLLMLYARWTQRREQADAPADEEAPQPAESADVVSLISEPLAAPVPLPAYHRHAA